MPDGGLVTDQAGLVIDRRETADESWVWPAVSGEALRASHLLRLASQVWQIPHARSFVRRHQFMPEQVAKRTGRE